MAARSIGSGTIRFSLVSIPVKLYTATRAQAVGFNLLHRDCGSRVTQVLRCAEHDPPVEITDRASQLVRGFEHTRDQYVTFTDEEIKALEASRPSELTLVEFVPEESVDLLYVERSYYLGPDKGGDEAYATLATALERTRRIAVGTFANRGKDVLVLIRAYKGGLLLHEAYFANEVLPFDEIAKPESTPNRQALAMSELLIKSLERPRFQPERFRDEWAEKVRAVVDQKLAGHEAQIAPPPPKAVVIDLVEALRRSVDAAADAAPAARAKGPKKASPRPSPESKKRSKRDA